MEAPIRLRTDGVPCDGGTQNDDTFSYIALEPGTYNQVTQIGFMKVVLEPGVASICRFWATQDGYPNQYLCGDTNGTTVWFRITTVGSVDGSTLNVYDCGTAGGYGSCTLRYLGAPYDPGVGLFASETTHACQTYMAGSSAAPVLIGNSTYPLQEQNAVGGSWASHTIAIFVTSDMCSFYNYSVSNTQVKTFDARN